MEFKDEKATLHIDLTQDLDTLWNNADKDARWGVKKARKEKLQVEQTNNDSDWQDFYEIYKETCIRGEIVPEPLEKLKQDILFVCKKENKIIAGAVIIDHGKRIELHYNASIYDYLKLQPNNILYWHLIEYGKASSKKIFDLGGFQLNASGHLAGINKFKQRWGGKIIKSQVKSKNPFYILGRKIIRNSPTIKKIRDKVKVKKYLDSQDK